MTIVSDDTVSKALAYLAEDVHPLANAEKAVLFAEKATGEAFAELYLKTEGTAKERESRVLLDPLYQAARQVEIEAHAERMRHKRRAEAAERILEIWRSEQANIRRAESIR